MDQRFLQHLGNEISLVGMVERRNVELELVGNLRKRVSTPIAVIAQAVHLREQGHRDRLGIRADQYHRTVYVEKHLTGLIAMIGDLVEVRER